MPATQSGLHHLEHAGIIKEADQRAAGLFCLFSRHVVPLFLFVVFGPFFLSPSFLSSLVCLSRLIEKEQRMEAGKHLSLWRFMVCAWGGGSDAVGSGRNRAQTAA